MANLVFTMVKCYLGRGRENAVTMETFAPDFPTMGDYDSPSDTVSANIKIILFP